MKTIIHFFRIHRPPAEVYSALTNEKGLSGWWTKSVAVETVTPAVVHFRFAGDFNPDMQVIGSQQDRRVEWKCIGGHKNWNDNTFSFVLQHVDGETGLLFTQHYAAELSDEVYGSYNYNWGWYLASLKEFCETGKGRPFSTQVAPR
jgi:uncharacterized protein YndB with AHSA1/START domain